MQIKTIKINNLTAPYKFILYIEPIFQGDFVGLNAWIQQRQNLLKRILVCLVVDRDNVGAEGNELIWYGEKASLQKILNYFSYNTLRGLISQISWTLTFSRHHNLREKLFTKTITKLFQAWNLICMKFHLWNLIHMKNEEYYIRNMKMNSKNFVTVIFVSFLSLNNKTKQC